MSKPTILYIIDDLTRGGAETLLIGILPELSVRYDIILVTLSVKNEFSDNDIICSHRYVLNNRSKWGLLLCVLKLKKIIRKHKPDIIHAHLLNSSLVARMACPARIPFMHTLHSILSLNAFNSSAVYKFFENRLFNKNHTVIAVTEEVLKDYEISIGTPVNKYVLSNYIEDKFFDIQKKLKDARKGEMKIVAVGNIKKVKNYEYLLNSFLLLKNQNISVDVYGRGEPGYIQQLEEFIEKNKINVKLKGQNPKVESILEDCDLFILCSKNEGFGMSAVEAMAAGVPLLLSDIPVLREVSKGNAFFFNLNQPASLANLVIAIMDNKYDLEKYSVEGRQIAQNYYAKAYYLKKLMFIYTQCLQAGVGNKPLHKQ
jgi:glycosyltransferase involved in cell wall biosynthesis